MTQISNDEYQWEAAFKRADLFAHDYFKLLAQYGDFPEANSIIENDLLAAFPDIDQFMNSDFVFFENESEKDDDDELSFIEMIDSNPVYSQIKKLAMAWTNIHVSVLPENNKKDSLKVLFFLGRSLANIMCTLNDDSIPEANVAFTKRTLQLINNAAGIINKLYHELPSLEPFLHEMVTQLSKTHDITVDYLIKLRK
ncbi:MAG: hypothetical protein ACRC37_00930 [Lentisphaeria bacterium]